MSGTSLLVTNQFPPKRGGIQNYLFDLYSYLPRDSFRVVTVPRPGGREFDAANDLPVTTVAGPKFSRGLLRALMLPTAMRVMLSQDISDIHCGVVSPDGHIGQYLSRLTGKPYLVFTYGKEVSPEMRPNRYARRRNVLNGTNVVVACSQFTRRLLLDMGISENKIEVITPSVDVAALTPGPKNPELVNKLGLGQSRVILSVGRLIERKGFDTVIRAMPKIVKAVPEAVYVVAGSRGFYLPRLQEIVAELGMQDHVRFLGDVNEASLPDLYRLCDVFAMVSRTLPNGDCEGFGIVLLEAQACGKPVIGGLSGGVPEALEDGVTGSLVDPTNPEHAADAIVRILRDQELAEQMGNAGRRRVEDEFSPQRQARRFMDLIDNRFTRA